MQISNQSMKTNEERGNKIMICSMNILPNSSKFLEDFLHDQRNTSFDKVFSKKYQQAFRKTFRPPQYLIAMTEKWSGVEWRDFTCSFD